MKKIIASIASLLFITNCGDAIDFKKDRVVEVEVEKEVIKEVEVEVIKEVEVEKEVIKEVEKEVEVYPQSVTLISSRDYDPSTWNHDEIDIKTLVSLPTSIPAQGPVGTGWTSVVTDSFKA